MASVDDFRLEWLSESGTIVAHTSGSTGSPKRILLQKSDMRQSARATNAFFSIDSHSVLASPLSVDYIAGKMMVVRACEAGCPLLELPVSNDIVIPSRVRRIDLLPVVPSQIASLLRQPELASVVKNVLVGGAPPAADDCRRLSDAGYRAYIGYGMTETCSHVAIAEASDPERTFHAMPGISFATDGDGRLIVEAPGFSFGRLIANDIVALISPTAMRWRGRADNIINSGGLKLVPEELEAMYAPALPGEKYYVTSVESERWGSAVALVIESESDRCTELTETLGRHIADHRYLPKQIICLPALPRTPNGKIKR